MATSISLRNKELDEEEINFAVQVIIDRLIFLRIAEDRGVENYGQLKSSVNQKGDSYKNLFYNFKQADEKYNSGLFDFKKDTISGKLNIENKVVKTIVNEMYYPKSPYEFSVISVEILGSAYEQFLGKVIRITPSHRAIIEEKPEVRKAGGVFYTPQYIVDYIVESTVGKLIEGKSPKQISSFKILDPACGSGSFLIGAFQYLLDYHKKYYTENGTKTGKKASPITPQGNLTSAEKKRILLNNIYGVDIDVNAVEVTKLSLLLKCMEGETATTIEQQQKLWHDRILPTLEDNVKVGNSLVDINFYDGQIDFDKARAKKIKPFSWERAFPTAFEIKETFKNQDLNIQFQKIKNLQDDIDYLVNKYSKEATPTYGHSTGFDVIIGNPPYGAAFSEEELKYLKYRFNTAVWRGESYLMFVELGLKLLRKDGFLGLIIPDTLLNLDFTQHGRELLLRNSKINTIVGLPANVFEGATIDTIILLTNKTQFTKKYHPSNILVKKFGKKQSILTIENPEKEFYIPAEEWFEKGVFNLQADQEEIELLEKIEFERIKVGNFSELFSGIKTYEVGKGNPSQTKETRDKKPFTSKIRKDKTWHPFFDGKHIGRYELLWDNNNWIKYGRWLAAPRKEEIFEGEKILIRKITGKTLIATYVPETSYCNTLLFVLKLKAEEYSYKSMLAILNSNLIGWYFRKKFQISNEDTFPQIMIRDILQFPIAKMNEKINSELTLLVSQLLQLNKEIRDAKLPTNIDQLENRMKYCDTRINQIVYEIYGLNDAEIKMVEG